jgi:hypothetical protein
MGGACSTNGGEGYWWDSQKERDHWKTKMYLREIGLDGVDWIDVAQDRDQWRALVNLRVPLNAGKFLSGCIIGGSSRRAQLRK